MILAHIVDDYYLQGILASMKQKKWWLEQKGYKDMYKNDYKMALLMHSMSWSIIISLPIMFFTTAPGAFIYTLFVLNAMMHYYIDNLKANELAISLVEDQSVHLIQILLTWLSIAMVSSPLI
jgi:hypothetical protein